METRILRTFKGQCEDRTEPDRKAGSSPSASNQPSPGAQAVAGILNRSTDSHDVCDRSTDFADVESVPSTERYHSTQLITAETVDENERDRILEDARRQLEADAVQAEVLEDLPDSKTYRTPIVVGAVVVIAIAAVIGGVLGNKNPDLPPTSEILPNSTHRQYARAAGITSFINNMTFSSENIAYPPLKGSSEEQAVQWLIDVDPLQLQAEAEPDQFRLRQRYALLTMWFQLSGENWTTNAKWLRAENECDWFGVTCDSNDAVSAILLPANNVKGHFPPDIALLVNMVSLDVSFNSLNGTLSDAIGQWTNLEFFHVGNNAMTGTLPESIGQWSNLVHANVGNNPLSGTIPESIANWSRIQEAYFHRSSFSGRMPRSICSSATLNVLMADCADVECLMCCTSCCTDGFDCVVQTLSPTSSPTFAVDSSRSDLIVEFINDKSFSAVNISFPPNIATAESLAVQWLIASDPLQLTVDTATDQFRLQQRYALLTLWFQSDQSEYPWRESSGWLAAEDECGWFGVTCIEKDLGGGIGLQKVVSEIRLFRNNVYGRIPADIALLTSVTFLDFSTSSLTGTLPASLWTMHSLAIMDISSGSLSGTLPDAIGGLTNMARFDIQSCTFNGTLPDSIGQWTSLVDFRASDNFLTGTLPDSIGQWTNLKHFTVDGNGLNGTIPESVANWSSIEFARFELNEFTGTMPSSLRDATYTHLKYLSADCKEVTCLFCTGCFR